MRTLLTILVTLATLAVFLALPVMAEDETPVSRGVPWWASAALGLGASLLNGRRMKSKAKAKSAGDTDTIPTRNAVQVGGPLAAGGLALGDPVAALSGLAGSVASGAVHKLWRKLF